MTYELRVAVITGEAPEGYKLVPNGEKIAEYTARNAVTYQEASLVACALNANTKAGLAPKGREYYVHPVTEQKAA